MRKLSFFVTGCIATVALLGFSVPAYALVDPDCDGEPHNNTPALHDVSVTNTVGDSNVEHAVAGLEGHGLACGTDISDNYVGVDTQYVRTDIETPLGVGVNDATGMTDGRYVGTANVNVASFLGGAAGVIEDVPAVLRIDQDSGTDCPVEALACFRGDTEHFLLEGHAWIWLTEDSGRYTLTIGEFYNDLSGEPSGLTHINSFVVCGYAGTVEGRECGTDPQSWLIANGDQSTVPSPDCSNGNGIFTITATMRNDFTTDPVDVCVPWVPEVKVDQDCDGTPYNNDFTINRFAVDTPDNHSVGAYADLTSSFLVCGTALISGNSDNGSDTLVDHIDFMNALGSYSTNTLGYQPVGSYAGKIEGRVAYHDNDRNPVIENTTATLKVDPLDLRFLDWPMPSNDDCNREAEDGLVGNNVGTTGEWLPGRPSSVIFVCLRADGVTDSGLQWHGWVWEIISAELESPEPDRGPTGGRRILTMGPVHMRGDGTAERSAGLTDISEFTICGDVGDVGSNACGSYRNGDDKLHRNGDASEPDCSNGNGIFAVRATMKNGDKTTPLIPTAGDPISDCVVWTNGRSGSDRDCSTSTSTTCDDQDKPELGGKRRGRDGGTTGGRDGGATGGKDSGATEGTSDSSGSAKHRGTKTRGF